MSNWERLTEKLMDSAERAFSEATTYTPLTADAFSIRAIFEPSFNLLDVQGDVQVSTVKPVFWFRGKDFEAHGMTKPKKKDSILARGKTYSVEQVEPDGYAEFRAVCFEVD